ncbi:MAG: imidazole glycerol phosphate synthase subunit HisH [Tagaea sp.]
MICVIDSGIANVGSVMAALGRIGASARVTADPSDVAGAAAVLLPGVGAFADGMAALRGRGLVAPLRAAAARGVPFLGICLGMQLLAARSEEFGDHEGLGLVPGKAVRLAPREKGERVPNMGWCDVAPASGAALFGPAADAFYFLHSYHLVCDDARDVAATLRYGGRDIAAGVARGRVFGIQFHPEKSQDAGLELLDRFVRFSAAIKET